MLWHCFSRFVHSWAEKKKYLIRRLVIWLVYTVLTLVVILTVLQRAALSLTSRWFSVSVENHQRWKNKPFFPILPHVPIRWRAQRMHFENVWKRFHTQSMTLVTAAQCNCKLGLAANLVQVAATKSMWSYVPFPSGKMYHKETRCLCSNKQVVHIPAAPSSWSPSVVSQWSHFSTHGLFLSAGQADWL